MPTSLLCLDIRDDGAQITFHKKTLATAIRGTIDEVGDDDRMLCDALKLADLFLSADGEPDQDDLNSAEGLTADLISALHEQRQPTRQRRR